MFSVVSFVGVFVCLFVCQRENSLTVSDINMKFLLEQARTSSKIAAFRCTAAREFLSSIVLMGDIFATTKLCGCFLSLCIVF